MKQENRITDVKAELDLSEENVIRYVAGTLQFSVLGFRATNNLDVLIATVKVTLQPHLYSEFAYVQKLNLYDNDRLHYYSRTAAFNLKVSDTDIKKGICALREKLERYRLDELRSSRPEQVDASVSDKTRKEAKAILQSDNIIARVEELLKDAGLVSESKNGALLFLILLTRHFNRPLHVLLQGSRELCKMLTDTVSSIIPASDIHQQTSMSASSLYYTKSADYWKHKVLHLDFIDRNFKGALTLKEFIDNASLKRRTTESDYATRQLYSASKTVSGPICLMAYSESDELNNRFFEECILLRVDVNETNKKEMLEHYRREVAGEIDPLKKMEAIKLLKEIQRQLRPVKVVIPFAHELELPPETGQPLRTYHQFITLIQVVCLLNLHRNKIKIDKHGAEYVEATPGHLENALELIRPLLATRLDQLGQGPRRLLEIAKKMRPAKNEKFRLPELVRASAMGKSSVYRYFEELVESGYIVKAGGNKKKGVEYRVAVWEEGVRLQSSLATLDTQLKKIEASFPQDSRKFPKKDKSHESLAG